MVGKNNRRGTVLFQTLIVIAIFLLVNVLSRNLYNYIDLTEDKRFTLTESTEKLLEDVEDIVYIDILLEGDLPAGFRRLKDRTEELINQFQSHNSKIKYQFRDLSLGSTKEINQLRENLSKDGIYPTNLTVLKDDQKVVKLIYPHAIIQYGPRKIPINLLENATKGEPQEEVLNRSANGLEYKFASAIEKLFKDDIPIVLFTTGNGELDVSQTATLETELQSTMNTARINLDSVYQIDSKADVLIVARPQQTMSERHKFIIDQYLMHGGKVIWIVEPFFVNVDSINVNRVYIPKPVEHGLDDMFFKYGVRIKKDLLLDLENSKIPQVIGRMGDQVQQELFPWVYYPLLQSSGKHPIVNNIDRVLSNFPSSIELLEDNSDRIKTVLLNSSRYSRFQVFPMRLSFEIVKLDEKPEAYNKPFRPAAVMVEGKFESFYKNRVSESMLAGLKQINAEFKEVSEPTVQIFLTDAEIIKNLYDVSSQRVSPLGYNKWEQMVYRGNSEFISNTIDYLTDEYGLLESRSKNLQLRMLDQVKLKQEKLKWQVLNILVPLIIVFLFGFIFRFWRNRKYASS